MSDLTITITIPEAARRDFIDAYCTQYGYVNIATNDTRAAFAKEQARKLVRAPLRMWRQDRAERDALATVTIADDGITSA